VGIEAVIQIIRQQMYVRLVWSAFLSFLPSNIETLIMRISEIIQEEQRDPLIIYKLYMYNIDETFVKVIL